MDKDLNIKLKEQTPLSRLKSGHLPLKKGEVLKKNGFTLVELLVVMAILAIMIAILIGILNPIALVNKASDSRRKNDLHKIKVAFESYYNDKGTYPTQQDVLLWNVVSNCGKMINQMKSYLRVLPCDPQKTPYEIIIINRNTFKVITNLQNKKDNNIPTGWYLENTYPTYSSRKNEVNYGVSSSNILWYDVDGAVDKNCGLDCLRKIGGSGCGSVTNGVCSSGGTTYCFVGQCTGNILGVPIMGIPENPQCYVNECCNGSGCD